MFGKQDIMEARERLAPYIYQTPVLHLQNLDDILGCRVYIKPECMQRTNSFKIRGALNKMLSMPKEELENGVVAASSGNHGKGVAFAAKLLGVKATIVIPDNAPQVKVDGIRKLGACLLYTSFLVVKDEEGRLQPSLATSWENVDDTTIRFTLRDDVVFHNGEKMTAEDVRYTLVRASEKSGSAPLFQSVDTENTKVIDDTTLELKLKEPMAPIFNFLSSPEGGILCKKAVEELGDDEFGRNPVGSGPLKLKNWTTGTSIELERNDEYWGEKPTYKTLLVKFIAEPANRTIELETGGVDLIYDVSTNDIDRIRDNRELRLISGTGLKHTYISISMEDPVMKDIRVREALAYALDMNSIVDAVFTGTAKTSDSVMSPNIFGYKSMSVNPYDPDQARALLKEAGYDNSLEITVKGYDNTQFVDILEIAQNMWKAVGITAKVDIMEYAAFAEQEAAGDIQMGISAFTASSGDPDQALGLWKSGYGGVLQGNDAKIDEYLDKGLSLIHI